MSCPFFFRDIKSLSISQQNNTPTSDRIAVGSFVYCLCFIAHQHIYGYIMWNTSTGPFKAINDCAWWRTTWLYWWQRLIIFWFHANGYNVDKCYRCFYSSWIILISWHIFCIFLHSHLYIENLKHHIPSINSFIANFYSQCVLYLQTKHHILFSAFFLLETKNHHSFNITSAKLKQTVIIMSIIPKKLYHGKRIYFTCIPTH